VAALAWKGNGRVDFDLLWSRQAISEELFDLIENWAVQIDRLLRATAGKRMPSEWAKKQECWDEIRDANLEIPVPAPAELARMSPDSTALDTATPPPSVGTPSDEDRDDLICNIRQLFRSAEVRSRDEIVAELKAVAIELGNTEQVEEEIDSAIRTAARRSILESRGDKLTLCTRSIADYRRDALKDQFLASMQGHAWAEREEGIRRFARWLGFRRTGPSIDDAGRSVINGLIRDGRLESNGSQIRRRG
jgi:hypothetical protein